ncbi:MAG: FdrA family protein [Alphaproteobacteria bacterium]|nr:FdrA family protein [Alphaproteobacteria bacterium]
MESHLEIRRGVYNDSVVLMQITSSLRARDGIEDAMVAMATPLNVGLLDDLGFEPDRVRDAGPADLLVALRARARADLDAGLAMLDDMLSEPRGSAAAGAAGPDIRRHATLGGAIRASGAGMAIISVPGPHVVPEAMEALEAGADVMIFSDGVSLTEERALKTAAERLGRLVMGPDCGTAFIAGAGLGFCNALSGGDVGIVAASGTGAQQVACLLEARGVGVGAIIGVGGRDTSDAIGSLSTLRSLALLDADPAITVIALVSKPPGEHTAQHLREMVTGLQTPVVLGLLGEGACDLTAIAAEVAERHGRDFAPPRVHMGTRAASCGPVAGLFSGGTLAAETRAILERAGMRVSGLDDLTVVTPTALAASAGDFVVDMGDDRLTAGRPHPMIDASLRRETIKALTRAGGPRNLLIDVVLGYGADDEPVAALAPAISAFLDADRRNALTASVIGTDNDPQSLDRQWQLLAELGCTVHESSAAAAREVATARAGAGSVGRELQRD